MECPWTFRGTNFLFRPQYSFLKKSPWKVHGNPWNPPDSVDSVRKGGGTVKYCIIS